MILAIDMGNTNIEIGCVDDEKILFTERVFRLIGARQSLSMPS